MIKLTQGCFTRKAIVFTMAFLLVPVTFLWDVPSGWANTGAARIYFSLADEFSTPGKQAQTIFDCSDKIYTVLELSDYARQRYQLSVQWRDPTGDVRETTRYPFSVKKPDTRLWAWLSLSRASGAGMLQWINPAAGLEEFIGIWEVEVRLNKEIIAREQFEVNC